MATGTVMPFPRFIGLDNSGAPLASGTLTVYVAGTTTLATTYSDVALTVANPNPIVLNSAGRPSNGGTEYAVYLTPGSSYKFVLQNSLSATIWTQDNVLAVPTSTSNLDITGTLGIAVTAGQAVYMSDGTDGNTTGSWYKADKGALNSNSTPPVGIVTADGAANTTATIRRGGLAPAPFALTPGVRYYVSTAGSWNVEGAQAASALFLGTAETTSALVLNTKPYDRLQPFVNDFRLTLTGSTPVTTADVTAATTLFWTPYTGNRVTLFDTNGMIANFVTVELSIAVPNTTAQMYDVFVFNSSGSPTLELLAWTNDSTRATALARTTNGRFIKSGDLTRLYVGSFRTTGVAGQTEDSFAKRYVWNYYNRIPRLMRATESTDTWTYSSNTFRQANANTANQLDFVLGVAEVPVTGEVAVAARTDQAAGTVRFFVGIGEDSTTAMTAGFTGGAMNQNAAANIDQRQSASLTRYPAAGRHFWAWLEASTAAGTTTWSGDGGLATLQSGITGQYLG